MVWMPVVTLERENNYEANLQTGDAPHGRDDEEFHLDCLVTILRSCLTQDLDLKTSKAGQSASSSCIHSLQSSHRAAQMHSVITTLTPHTLVRFGLMQCNKYKQMKWTRQVV